MTDGASSTVDESQESDEELVRMANGSKTENDRYERALNEVTEIQRLLDHRCPKCGGKTVGPW